MPSPLYVPILVAGMLITGSSNSLWTKFQDMQCVENCDDDDPSKHVLYEQPVWQSMNMFIGELGCFIPILYTILHARFLASRRSRQQQPVALPTEELEEPSPPPKPRGLALKGSKVFLLWLPALCDLTGTTLMNVGLLYTPVSIYQMTRGALVLFVGVLSVLFLDRRLHVYQWVSLLIVMSGVAVVGLSGSLVKQHAPLPPPEETDETLSILYHAITQRSSQSGLIEGEGQKSSPTVLIGVFFILFAQIFTAIQFVLEEKIMAKYSVKPLVAVGYEGLFGFTTILLLTPLLAQFADKSPFFDLPRGWQQTISTPTVWGSSIAIAFSIGFFNFFGLSVTRHISATARSITDTCRTILIWIISLGLGWETLVWPWSLLQVTGFGMLVYGTFLFNDLIAPPSFLAPPPSQYQAIPSEEIEGDHQQHHPNRNAEEALDQSAVLPADLGSGGYDVIPPPVPVIDPETEVGHGRRRG